MVRSIEFLVTGHQELNCEVEQRIDCGNIEEAESSIRQGICLNYEVCFSNFLMIYCI